MVKVEIKPLFLSGKKIDSTFIIFLDYKSMDKRRADDAEPI